MQKESNLNYLELSQVGVLRQWEGYDIVADINTVFVTFKLANTEMSQNSLQFQESEQCLHRNELKFHISIREGSMDKAFPIVYKILRSHGVRNFKVVRPGIFLSQHSQYSGYDYSLLQKTVKHTVELTKPDSLIEILLNETGLDAYITTGTGETALSIPYIMKWTHRLLAASSILVPD